jgi:hypothetical protein
MYDRMSHPPKITRLDTKQLRLLPALSHSQHENYIYLSAEGVWEIFMRKRNQVIASYLKMKHSISTVVTVGIVL